MTEREFVEAGLGTVIVRGNEKGKGREKGKGTESENVNVSENGKEIEIDLEELGRDREVVQTREIVHVELQVRETVVAEDLGMQLT